MKSVETRVETVEALRRVVAAARAGGKRIGLVPTMGALHRGHAALIDASVAECDFTVVSIFVNALQFGPQEDFAVYPRDLDADQALCEEHGVDVVFAPTPGEMYPSEQRTFVDVTGLTDGLCGAFRPGHFRGVTTVVAKLFHIASPDVAYFGAKDAQQLVVIRRMVRDLNFPIEVRAVATVREESGLALSSRNRYLSDEQQKGAAAIYQGLQAARALLEAGETNPERVRQAVRDELVKEPGLREQYVEVVDAEELERVKRIEGRTLVAVAAYAGKTRLIDNIFYPDLPT